MSAEAVINEIIQNANAIAKQTVNAAIGYADDAQTAAISVVNLGQIPVPEKPHVDVPLFAPDPDEAEDKFRTTFYELYNYLTPEFDKRLAEFLKIFFPNMTKLQQAVDDWLYDVITTGADGIPPAVEAQIWERSRAREFHDSERRMDEIMTGFAGRGFSLPPGALYAAEQDVQQDLSEKISTHSRDVAIKQAEIQIETIKFAITEANRLRIAGLEATLRYLAAWLDLGKMSVEYANGILRARTSYYSALSAYYGALIASERLVYDWGKDQAIILLGQERDFVAITNANTDARVKAALSAAESVAGIGRAAMAAQNSMANLSNETFIQQ